MRCACCAGDVSRLRYPVHAHLPVLQERPKGDRNAGRRRSATPEARGCKQVNGIRADATVRPQMCSGERTFEYARLARQMLQSGPFNSTSVTEAMVNQGTFLQGGGACLPPPQVLLPARANTRGHVVAPRRVYQECVNTAINQQPTIVIQSVSTGGSSGTA